MGEPLSEEIVADADRRGYERARVQAVELLEREIEKTKACGDFQTAEVFELIRAKLKNLSDRSPAR